MTTAPRSRYDISRVPEPAQGYPSLPTSLNNTAATLTPVAVVDVYDERRRHRALMRVDLLAQERRAGRLDEASYRAGRDIESAFERMGRVSGGMQWLFGGDKIDSATQAEMQAILGVENAYKVNALLSWMVKHLGKMDTRIVWCVLGDRLSFTAVAASFGRKGVRGRRYVHDRFCDSLATLAEAKAARGKQTR